MSKTVAYNKSLLETRLHFQQSEANNAKLYSADWLQIGLRSEEKREITETVR